MPRSPRTPLAVLGLAAVLTLAAALAVAVTAAGRSPARSSARGPEHASITVGVVPSTDTAPLLIAIERGYFKRQGLTVTTKIVADVSTAAAPSRQSGRIDIVAGGYVSYFEAAARGAKITVVAAASQCAGNTLNVLVAPKSKITTPAGLAGKTIAVNLTGNMPTLTINALLSDQGVNPAGITYVQIPFASMPAALAAGQVDAISEAEPYITETEGEGATSVLAQCQGSTVDMPLTGYFASRAWVRAHPEAALAFQRAIGEAQAAADKDPGLVRQLIPAFTGISADVADRISLPYYPPGLDAAQLERVVALMRSAGLVGGSFNVMPLLLRPGR
ncbi:MAG TPA: ABC transporter substrate-binding protein [Streptosporangiaceae bacterium]|nr:ABC transporter substrate-binding protein [Streptosporangiaceae bacterium]